MTYLTRRTFTAGIGAGAMLAGSRASAQGAGLSFMSFSFAEEANKALVQKLGDDFAADSGMPMQVIGSAWGDMQRNIMLRQRSKSLPTSAQISERWLPSFQSVPELMDLNEVVGKAVLEGAIDTNVLAVGRIGAKLPRFPGDDCVGWPSLLLVQCEPARVPSNRVWRQNSGQADF